MMQFLCDYWWMFALGAVASYLVGIAGWVMAEWNKNGYTTAANVGGILGALLALGSFLIVSNLCWLAFLIGVILQIIKFAKHA